MSQQNTPNRRKPNALSEYKLRLTAKPVAPGSRAPNFGIVVVKNQPHLVVRTNVENDKNYGKIEAKLDTPTYFALIEALSQIIDGPNGARKVISNMGHPFANGQRSKEPKLDTKVLVGKSAEGVVWIAVTSWEQSRPVIQFSFAPTQYHQWAHGDGTPLTEAEASVLYAKSYIRNMSALVPLILFDEYVEPEPRGGQGNWQQNNSNSSTQSQQQSHSGGGGGDFDDGLPM